MKYLIIDEERPELTAVVKALLEEKTKCKVYSKKPDEAIKFNKKAKPEIIQLSDDEINPFVYRNELLKDNKDANFLLFTPHSGSCYMADLRRAGIAHFRAGHIFDDPDFDELVDYVLDLQQKETKKRKKD